MHVITTKQTDIYLLIDISGSMAGEPIESVNISLYKLFENLRIIADKINSKFCELINFSIISYNQIIYENLPLTKLIEIQNIQIGPAMGPTHSGQAINFIYQNIINSLSSNKSYYSDYKPPMFIHITDGCPSDIEEYRLVTLDKYKNIIVNKIGCAIGQAADLEYLSKFSSKIIILESNDKESIEQYVEWLCKVILSYLLSDDDDLSNIPELNPNRPQNPSLTNKLRLEFINK